MIAKGNRKGQISSTRTPSPLAGLRVQPLRGQIAGAYDAHGIGGIRRQPGAEEDNVGNPRRHLGATSGATQTSYDFQTSFPSEEGVTSHTCDSPSSTGYKKPGAAPEAAGAERRTEDRKKMNRTAGTGRRKTVEVREGGKPIAFFSSEAKADAFRKELKAEGRASVKYIRYEDEPARRTGAAAFG